MSVARNVFSKVMDLVVPDEQPSKLTFTKYDGNELLQLAKGEITAFSASGRISVVLNTNPEALDYAEPKLVQKIQTLCPGSFVIFDWGTDLQSLNMSGNTGQLIPPEIVESFNVTGGKIGDILNTINPGILASKAGQTITGITTGIGQYTGDVMFGSMTYDELIELSPKYRTFLDLISLYRTFDADRDILIMELGNSIYRGYLVDFSFTHTAATPWNYKYKLSFMSLQNLTDSIRKDDKKHKMDAVSE